MAMLVVVMDRDDRQVLLTPSHVAALGRLGVVSVGLVADERTLAVVVEGWAFDAVRSADSRPRRSRSGGPRSPDPLPAGSRRGLARE